MIRWRCVLLPLLTLPLQAQEDGAAFFEKNIRPMLVAKCLGCHSATSQPVMGGLRLDTREGMIKGGSRGTALVPGNPAASLLVKVVLHEAGALKMPPGPRMKDSEAAMLAQWVAMGAPWGAGSLVSVHAAKQKYWSFVPPREPKMPAVKNTAWAKNPIDMFILAGLESKGLAPTRPADRRTLIRRVTYDLTGLPPAPADVEAFASDTRPEAYAELIDRLLASPRYGERWGRHWLDVARYADSNGLDENLVYKNAFRYRDYVIAAFNKDKPYDQFVKEQIAGDLLPAPADLETQYERWTATGFLSLGAKMLAEDDPKKMQMDIVDEQLDTTSKAFMGLTVGCARCHDHKFDPIPTRDYYAMAGIFKSTHTMDNFKVVAKWHEHVLANPADRQRLAEHEAKVEAKKKEAGAIIKTENEKIVAEALAKINHYLLASREVEHSSRIVIAPVEREAGAIVRTAASFDRGNAPRTLEKGKPNTQTDVKGPYWAEFDVRVPKAGWYQFDILNEESGAGTADVYVNDIWARMGAGPVENRAASPEAGGWKYVAIIELKAGVNRIKLQHPSRFPYFEKILLALHTSTERPLNVVQAAMKHGINPGILAQLVDYFDRSQGATASVLYAWEILDRKGKLADWASPVAALFGGNVPQDPAALASAYQKLFTQADAAGKDTSDAALKALYGFLKEKFGPFRAPANARRYYPAAEREKLIALEAEAKTLEEQTPVFPRAMGVKDYEKAEDIPIHLRGSHWNLGEKVQRGFLSAIDIGIKFVPEEAHSGRLEFANWLTSKDHPLTSRVMVNRIWRWHFGRGIVSSVDNFGRLGDKPSHPELLDWLALRFVDSGWSIKAMHRMILLSNTYQMGSDYDAKAFEIDPENILLWRMPRRRLEAEAIRDALISSAGALDYQMGGSMLTYKDRQYVANTAKGSNVDYDKPIRSVYLPVLRSSMYEVFSAFDLPDPTMSNGDRDSTVVAPQALFMMNSSVMLKNSLKMAQSLLNDTKRDPAARVRAAYQRALSRPASGQEVDAALTFIANIEKEWKGDELRAWQSFCKSLLASNEFIYLN
jgi:hypothetical protein